MRGILAAVLLVALAAPAYAEEIAYTESGKKVILHDDGTWEYAPPDEAAEGDFDFRSTRWGMTKAEVVAAEGKPDVDGDKTIAYQTQLSGEKVLALFEFTNGLLTSGIYHFSERYINENDYIRDYNRMKGLLTQRYGEPIEDRVIWENSRYRDQPERYGLALSLGYLSYYARWETERTLIRLMLGTSNTDILFGIQYSSKEHTELVEKATLESHLSGL